MNEMTGFKEIEIGGRKRPVKYGWNTLALLEERTKVNALNPLEIAQAALTATFQTALIEIGLQEGCRVTKQPVDFTREDIGAWLDTDGFKKIREFRDLFSKSIAHASMIGMSEDEKKSLERLSLGLTSEPLPSEKIGRASCRER